MIVLDCAAAARVLHPCFRVQPQLCVRHRLKSSCLFCRGHHRVLHLSIRRQRRMCIRDRCYRASERRADTCAARRPALRARPVPYTYLRAHETLRYPVCRLLLLIKNSYQLTLSDIQVYSHYLVLPPGGRGQRDHSNLLHPIWLRLCRPIIHTSAVH